MNFLGTEITLEPYSLTLCLMFPVISTDRTTYIHTEKKQVTLVISLAYSIRQSTVWGPG